MVQMSVRISDGRCVKRENLRRGGLAGVGSSGSFGVGEVSVDFVSNERVGFGSADSWDVILIDESWIPR